MVSLKEMARADAQRAPPAWLQVMLMTTFFTECPEHQGQGTASARTTRSATACNFFCTCCDVGRALCAACVAAGHRLHEVVQIRKSSNHTVVRVSDLARLLDVSLVQTYMINGDSVVFLNPRPVTGQGKPSAARCQMCERGIQDVNCRFCSLGCKLEAMDGDFDVTFAVPPRTDSETSSDGSDDNAGASRLTKLRRLGNLSGTGNEGAGGKISGGDGGAGTSGEPPAAPAAPAANPPPGRRRSRKGVPERAPFF